jgi:hypothetical protein
MLGVSIGDNVVIGANSLVSRDLPSNCLAAGSPAKVIKENYPPNLIEQSRKLIIENIFKEFINYINYYNFTIDKISLEKGTKYYITKNRKSYCIIYLKELKTKNIDKHKNNILILDSNEDIIDTYKNNSFRMIISLKNKNRIGTSYIGDEFVRFISRFGIRFERLD